MQALLVIVRGHLLFPSPPVETLRDWPAEALPQDAGPPPAAHHVPPSQGLRAGLCTVIVGGIEQYTEHAFLPIARGNLRHGPVTAAGDYRGEAVAVMMDQQYSKGGILH